MIRYVGDLTEEEKVSRFLYSSSEVLVEYDRVGFYPEEERLITRYFSNKNAKILDIGCGLGRTTQPLSDMGFEVIGIDVSEAMINKARAKFPTIDFRIGDACDFSSEMKHLNIRSSRLMELITYTQRGGEFRR